MQSSPLLVNSHSFSTSAYGFMSTLPTVTFSPAAIEEIQRLKLQNSCGDSDAMLKLEAVRGGCIDWYYKMSFTAEVEHLNHQGMVAESLRLMVPTSSQQILAGLHVDYSEDLMGGGFRFLNPNAVQTCGCGNSFSTNTM